MAAPSSALEPAGGAVFQSKRLRSALNMAESSDATDSIARKSLTAILNAVERVGQNVIAEGCQVDNSTITGDKAKYWPRFAKTLAIAGLKVVPAEHKCYSPEYIEHLHYFAKLGMAEAKPPLEWERVDG